MSKFAVTLNYHGNYGYVEYDSENKKAEIVLGVAEAKAKVEKFLNEKHPLLSARELCYWLLFWSRRQHTSAVIK